MAPAHQDQGTFQWGVEIHNAYGLAALCISKSRARMVMMSWGTAGSLLSCHIVGNDCNTWNGRAGCLQRGLTDRQPQRNEACALTKSLAERYGSTGRESATSAMKSRADLSTGPLLYRLQQEREEQEEGKAVNRGRAAGKGKRKVKRVGGGRVEATVTERVMVVRQSASVKKQCRTVVTVLQRLWRPSLQ